MSKKRTKDLPPIGKAILAGNVEEVKNLLDTDSILFKKGKIMRLKSNIPQTYYYNGEEHTVFVDAFRFALSNRQTEIAKLFINRNVVDMSPGAEALFMAIRSKNFELFSYMLEKGAEVKKNEDGINRLFLNLMDAWSDDYIPIIKKMNLPIKENGASSLCSAVYHNHIALVEFLLSAGVSVNCRGKNFRNTPVLYAAENNNFEMLKFLVEHGANLSLKNDIGICPYIAAKKNNNIEMATYIKAHEIDDPHRKEAQDKLFEDYHVPKEMAEYLKSGNLKLEFPNEERLHWIKLFSYMDLPEISYQGKKVLSLVEDSEDYDVMLIWEPESRKIWFIDMEHDIFHAVSTWSKFIQNAGHYINRAIMWDFD